LSLKLGLNAAHLVVGALWTHHLQQTHVNTSEVRASLNRSDREKSVIDGKGLNQLLKMFVGQSHTPGRVIFGRFFASCRDIVKLAQCPDKELKVAKEAFLW
jgi:hypothetical protein